MVKVAAVRGPFSGADKIYLFYQVGFINSHVPVNVPAGLGTVQSTPPITHAERRYRRSALLGEKQAAWAGEKHRFLSEGAVYQKAGLKAVF